MKQTLWAINSQLLRILGWDLELMGQFFAIAALRELMHLGPNDPAPQPPPLPAQADKKTGDDKKQEKKTVPAEAAAVEQ